MVSSKPATNKLSTHCVREPMWMPRILIALWWTSIGTLLTAASPTYIGWSTGQVRPSQSLSVITSTYPSHEPNQGHIASEPSCFQRPSNGARTTNLNDMIHPSPFRDL